MNNGINLEIARRRLDELAKQSIDSIASKHSSYKDRPTNLSPPPSISNLYSEMFTQFEIEARNQNDDMGSELKNRADAELFVKLLYFRIYSRQIDQINEPEKTDYVKTLKNLLEKGKGIDKAPLAYLLAKFYLEESQNPKARTDRRFENRVTGDEIMRQLINHKSFGSAARDSLNIHAPVYDQTAYAEEFIKKICAVVKLGKQVKENMGAAQKIGDVLKKYNIDINKPDQFILNAKYVEAMNAMKKEFESKNPLGAGVTSLIKGRSKASTAIMAAITKSDLAHPMNRAGLKDLEDYIINPEKPKPASVNVSKPKFQ